MWGDLGFLLDLEQLSLDFVRDWLESNLKESFPGDKENGGLSIRGLATYQPYDGLTDLKMVSCKVSYISSFFKKKNVYLMHICLARLG